MKKCQKLEWSLGCCKVCLRTEHLGSSGRYTAWLTALALNGPLLLGVFVTLSFCDSYQGGIQETEACYTKKLH